MTRTTLTKYVTRTAAMVCLVAVMIAASGGYPQNAIAAGATGQWYTPNVVAGSPEIAISWPSTTIKNNVLISAVSTQIVSSPAYTVEQLLNGGNGTLYCSTNIGGISMASNPAASPFYAGITLDGVYSNPTITCHVRFVAGGANIWSKPVQHTFNYTPVTLNSWNCPERIYNGTPFTCSPSMNFDLTTSQLSGAYINWTTDSGSFRSDVQTTVASNPVNLTGGQNITIPIYGATKNPTLTATAVFPALGNMSQSFTMPQPMLFTDAVITGMICPSHIVKDENFTCVPQITTTGMSESEKLGAIYTWIINYENTLTQNGNLNPDATLKISSTSGTTKNITVTVKYPNANNYTTSYTVQDIPYKFASIQSLGYFSSSLKPPFACQPQIITSLTEAEKAGAVYTWSSDNGNVSADRTDIPYTNLNISNYTNGPTNLTLHATYPAVGMTVSRTQSVELNSEGVDFQPNCPAVVLKNNAIICAPNTVSNPATDRVQYMSLDGSVNYTQGYYGGFSFDTPGQKEIMVYNDDIPARVVKIQVLDGTFNATNCPAEVYANEPFRCNPDITTIPADYPKTDNEFNWTGQDLQVNQDGTLQFKTTGTKQINAYYNSSYYANPAPPPVTEFFTASQANTWGESMIRLTRDKSQNITVKSRDMSITSAGCPASTLSTKSFTCTPVITADIPAELRKDIVYNWVGDGLVVNPDKTLQFTTGGTKTIVLTATYPGISAKTTTATINVNEPQTTVSMNCPEAAFTEESITCTPEITTNLPEEFKAGMTKAWTGEGLVVNQDGSMKFTTEGTKTATFTMSYPLANYKYTTTKSFTVTKPTLAVTSLNCPAEVLANEKFTCTPEITTNLPTNYLNNIKKIWTGTDVLPKDNNYVAFSSTGQKTLNVRLEYPGAEPVTASANITVWGSTVNIISLGCPTEPKVQEAFKCTPVIETDMSQVHKDKLTYSWSGLNMDIADDGSMAMTAPGNKTLTLVVALPEKQVSVRKTEMVNVVSADATIKTLGCPAMTYFGNSFTCTPEMDPAGSTNNLQYVWSGTDLEKEADGKMKITKSGTGKKITLTVTNPETGLRLQKTESINVTPIVVSIEAHGCSTKIKGMQPFKCVPALKTNVLDIKDALTYTWSGPELYTNQDGTLMFKTEGTKTVTLRITHPNYPQVQVEKSFALEVSDLSLKVENLGCSKNITEYAYSSCRPKIISDLSIGNMVYDWQLNGERVGTEKILQLLTKAPGTSALSLAVKIVDPDTNTVAAESSLSEEISISPNSSKLKLYVVAPSRAERGTEITMEAKTIFQVDEIMDYTWTVNGTEYKGKKITIPIPNTQTEPITYSVTAKPNCCEMIVAETKNGTVRTAEYKFPSVVFSGPSNATVNVAPYEATFKVSVITTSNLTYTWDFGDGSPLEVTDKTVTRMKHVYTAPGAYVAKLTVKDMNDEVREFQGNVTVMPLPERDIEIKSTMSNSYNRRPVTGFFKYGISNGLRRDTPVSNKWSVNDEVISEKPSAMINFNEAGSHTVDLEVKTKYGNVLHESATVEVQPNTPPQCGITKEPFGTEKYKLTANCTDSDGKVVRYKWDLGGGVTSSSSNAYLNTKVAGDYPVSLTATDDSGDSVTVNDIVSVPESAAPAGQ